MNKFFVFSVVIMGLFVFTVANATNQVEINTASLQQLDEIIGIGPALAQRIIDDRPFSSVDDLLRVRGIGEKTLQKIKEQGLAYVAGQPQQLTQKINPPPTPAIPSMPVITPLPEPIKYQSGIFINEILPSPEGADETSEWIELYNSNNSDIDLSGWKIQDTEGTITTYIFLENKNILSNGYLVLKRPETKITLNNDQDSLSLISPDEKIIDSISYKNALKNQSYNKTSSGWEWGATLTPGAVNIITLNSPKEITKTLPKPNKTDNNKTDGGLGTASISDAMDLTGNEISNGSNPWFLFLIALAITIISAIIILILKLKLKGLGNLTPKT